MPRFLASTVLLSLAAPMAALASDVAAPDVGAETAPVIAAAANGSLRLIYLEEPPAIPADRALPLPRLAGQPPSRPVIVVAGACAWDDRAAGLGQIRSAFAASPIWLLEPDSATCDPTALKTAFETAAALPERERLAHLLGRGLHLSAAEPVATAQSTPSHAGTTPDAGLFSGKLVISSLPTGTSLGGGAPTVIQATAPDTITSAQVAEASEAAPAETAAASAQPAVRNTTTDRAGLPEPAVVVGELATLLAADKRSATGAPREVRDRIREIDPAFFMTLLDLGNFDPEEGQYVAAIQSELSGMNCYSGAVDGNWGPGSSSATDRYFSELGTARQTETPGLALYREIVTHPRVDCPAPVVTVRTEPGATATRPRDGGTGRASTASRPRGGTAGTTGTAQSAPRGNATRPAATATAAPPTASQPNSPPRIDSSLVGSVGSGVIK